MNTIEKKNKRSLLLTGLNSSNLIKKTNAKSTIKRLITPCKVGIEVIETGNKIKNKEPKKKPDFRSIVSGIILLITLKDGGLILN